MTDWAMALRAIALAILVVVLSTEVLWCCPLEISLTLYRELNAIRWRGR